MIAGRARMVYASILGLALLLPTSAVPAAAATCALSAPATVKVGTPLDIIGSGFPVSSAVDVSIGLEGATPDDLSVQSDGAGAFTISLVPEPADAGTTTVVATAGTSCSARAVINVVGTAATPTPGTSPSSPPAGPAASGAAPPTDTAPAAAAQTADSAATGWALALVILLIGAGGVFTTRRTRHR